MVWDYQPPLDKETMYRRRAYSDVQPRPPRFRRNGTVSPPQFDLKSTPTTPCIPFGRPGGDAAGGIPVPRSSNPYAGMVVGSPLGSGPLNGSALPLLALAPSMGSSPPSNITSDYMSPVRRPRLSSASEAPTVAPIPENLPLPDTPPRHPFHAPDARQVSTEPPL